MRGHLGIGPTDDQAPDPTSPLLRSKVTVPAAPGAVVARPRLAERLTAGVRGPVTLLSAPPGWGKTVLLSGWVDAGGAGTSVAWLTVDAGDRSATFWPHLRAALDTAATGASGLAGVPPLGAAPDRTVLGHLAEVLARRADEPVVLVLDDLHHLRDQQVLDGLEFLLRHSGPGLRLVIGSRTDPSLPLHRWRLSGELTELRADVLAFTRAEAAELLAAHGLVPTDAELTELYARTEGWPAALRLAAMAGGLAAAEQSIADYVVEEVLAGQPADLRELLPHLSVLDRICGGLVEEVAGRPDGDRILAELDRANVFLTPVADRPGWYRFHPLFRDVLRAELRRESAGLVTVLNDRAARWYASAGQPVEALHHALAAGDRKHALALLAGDWPEILAHAGTRAPIRPAGVPPEEADPELALARAATCLWRSDVEGARQHLRTAERSGRPGAPAAALRLAEAQLRGDVPRMLREAPRLVDRLTDPADGGRAFALAALGSAQLAAGDLADAESTLADALAAAHRAGDPCLRLSCAGRLALVHAVRGDLGAAERTAVLDRSPCGTAAHLAPAHLALALVHLQRDRTGEAAAQLSAVDSPGGEPPLFAMTLLARVALLRDRDELAEAYRLLRAGRRDLGAWAAPPSLEHALVAAEADLRTAHGEPAAARDLLGPLLAKPSVPVALALARTLLHEGRPDEALRALPSWTAEGAPVAQRLDAGLLEALAARRDGDQRRATTALEQALRLAEPDGYRRVFTRSGPAVRELLAEHLDSGTAYWFWVSELVGDAPSGGEPGPPLDEPLTERELTVLRYLQSILSTVEIAGEMCLSINTIKTHVRNIYRKLGTRRRREAVRRARELRLL